VPRAPFFRGSAQKFTGCQSPAHACSIDPHDSIQFIQPAVFFWAFEAGTLGLAIAMVWRGGVFIETIGLSITRGPKEIARVKGFIGGRGSHFREKKRSRGKFWIEATPFSHHLLCTGNRSRSAGYFLQTLIMLLLGFSKERLCTSYHKLPRVPIRYFWTCKIVLEFYFRTEVDPHTS